MSVLRVPGPLVPAIDIDAALRALIEKILSVSQPEAIWLFGSAARGTAQQGSDLDLAIVYTSAAEALVAKRAVYGLAPLSEWSVDLLFFDRATFEAKKRVGGVCFVIQEEGRIVYRKGEHK